MASQSNTWIPKPIPQGLLDRVDESYCTVLPNGCWEWNSEPSAKGYGQICFNYDNYLAHRVVYTKYRRPLLTTELCDHICRYRRCVNPGHIEPVDCAVNVQRGCCVKLTTEIAYDIRVAIVARKESRDIVAARYGVSTSLVTQVVRGKRWKNAAGPTLVDVKSRGRLSLGLTEERVRNIRTARKDGLSLDALVAMFGVSRSHCCRLCRGC